MRSFLDHLECTSCGSVFSHSRLLRTCPNCGKVLFARYDLAALKADVDRDALEGRVSSDMWRFFELLPVQDPARVVGLGEGGTPLLRAAGLGGKLGIRDLFIKEEGLNPTGTFKARGLSAAVSRAVELGATKLSLPSAGNAAGAIAVYAAKAGLEAHVFMPRDVPEANIKECVAMGARLTLVDGHIGDAGRICREVTAREGLFDMSTLQEPYRVEGKKTMGLEIAMQLGWRMPDVIVYPTGGGTGIIGMWKAFYELLELAWVEGSLPRFVAVQPEGCQPVVRAFETGAEETEAWPEPGTVADGLRVPNPFAGYLILRALRDTGGTALAVSDAEMIESMKELASTEGVFACPEGAATLAGLNRLVRDGTIASDDTVVLLNTGSGYKYLDLIQGAG